MTGRCDLGEDLDSDLVLSPDICIIGSGAGGSVLAAGLCKEGLSVVLIEEGGYHHRPDFDLLEANTYPKLYQDRGTRGTADLAITILQGRTAGGGTTINWTTCFRTPDRILHHWAERHGLTDLTNAALAPHFTAVEERLGITEWPSARANRNNQSLRDGCAALGWDHAPLRRNVRGCYDSGYCGMGCPTGAKQDMVRTYLQDALDAGLHLIVDTRVDRLHHDDGRVVEVEGTVLDRKTGASRGPKVRVRPKRCVVSGGAINSPALLLRSGINVQGYVGKRTYLHPVIAVAGVFPEPIRAWAGAPQSIGSHHHQDRGPGRVGFFLEAPPLHPMLGALAFGGHGADQARAMAAFENTAALIALSIDGLLMGDEGGTVSLRRDGRLRVDYPITDTLRESFHASHRALAEVLLAAGATTVRTLHAKAVELRSTADLAQLDAAPYGAHEHSIFTAHQMGGCAMAGPSHEGVVDPDHRVRGFTDLFVVDGSVLPTSLGVNPSQTIYALAHRAVDFVAEGLTR